MNEKMLITLHSLSVTRISIIKIIVKPLNCEENIIFLNQTERERELERKNNIK